MFVTDDVVEKTTLDRQKSETFNVYIAQPPTAIEVCARGVTGHEDKLDFARNSLAWSAVAATQI